MLLLSHLAIFKVAPSPDLLFLARCKQCEWLVLETVRILGLDVAGVDLLIDNNTYKICEVNSSPGL